MPDYVVAAGGVAGVGAGSIVADKIVSRNAAVGIVGPAEVTVIRTSVSRAEVIGKMPVVVEIR